MNLLKSVKVSTIFTSTAGASAGSTGPVAGLSTAGSSGGDSTTLTGIPFGSTGLDMQGYDGVVFIASVTGSTGVNFLRAAWSAVSSTDAITNFTEYPTAHVKGNSASTVYDTVVLDVVRPVKRYIAAIVGVAATSEVVQNITAIQYLAGKAPVTSISTGYFLTGAATAVGTT